MIIYSLDDLTLREVKALRKSLDYIPITGIDAAFIAMLQHKISTQTQEIEQHIQKEETAKQRDLHQAIQDDPKKNVKTARGRKKP